MSDEVTNFLRSVEQLKDRRLEEDEARSRELEEKILQEKRERQARRAERARSISPQKSSPANTPPPPSSHQRYNSSQSTDTLKPISSTPARSIEQHNITHPTSNSVSAGKSYDYPPKSTSPSFQSSSSPTKENESPFSPDAKLSTSSLARSSTLSWQRRPPSSAGQPTTADRPRSRPLSMFAAENAAARSSHTSISPSIDPTGDAPLSRDKIALNLAAKDPSWFRQTADRGLNSAAYRRSQVEDNDRQDLTSASAQLPGMSRAPSSEPELRPEARAPSRSVSPAISPSPTLQPAGFKLSSVPPLTPSQKFDTATDSVASPPLSGRSSPTRPPSPTKGAGGFVQSAMMKRSDSVKRWSVTSPPGLQRADSIASNRGTFGSVRRTGPVQRPSSRPTSSHGVDSLNSLSNLHISTEADDRSRASTPPSPLKASITESDLKNSKVEEIKVTPPSSPTKTMDSRRWSPTKSSSWLEAALNKSESPKPKTAPPSNSQPAWMVELNKTKAQKAINPETEIARSPSVMRKHDVKTGGLMRSSPMGSTSVPVPTAPGPSRTGLGINHSPSTPVSSTAAKLSAVSSPKPNTPPKPTLSKSTSSPSKPTPTTSNLSPKPTLSPKPSLMEKSSIGDKPVVAKKPREVSKQLTEAAEKSSIKLPIKPIEPLASEELKPTAKPKPSLSPNPNASAKNDFRANLKPRQRLPSEKKGAQVNELQNIVGNLRRTKTQNYVAPDTLKDNILRGKTALSVTGGPKPREKKDELKDAILQKKASFTQAKAEGRGVTTNNLVRDDKQELPEGLAKRLEMNKTGSSRSASPVRNISSDATTMATNGPLESLDSNRAVMPPPALTKRDPSASVVPEKKEVDPPAVKPLKSTNIGHNVHTTAGSVLANRFNPALASILARGPPAPASGAASPTSPVEVLPPARAAVPRASSASENAPGAGPKLTHMTKSRARGPRRKAPTALQQSKSSAAEPTEPAVHSPAVRPIKTAPAPGPKKRDITPRIAPLVDLSKTIAPGPSSSHTPSRVVSAVESTKEPEDDAPTVSAGSDVNTVDSSKVRANQPRTPAKPHATVAAIASARDPEATPVVDKSKSEETDKPRAQMAPSPRKLDVKRMSQFLDDVPLLNAAEVPRPLSITKTRAAGARPLPDPVAYAASQKAATSSPRPLPIPVSTKRELSSLDDGETRVPVVKSPPAKPPAMRSPSVKSPPIRSPSTKVSATPSSPGSPLAPKSQNPVQSPPTTTTQKPQLEQSQPSSPAVPLKTKSPSPALVSPALPSLASSKPIRSLSKQPTEISVLIRNFFGAERPDREFRVDTAEILSHRPVADSKVDTLQAQLFRVSSDGTKQPVPAMHERILFESEMYLCPHTFTNNAGKKVTEVYFWVGDDVPQALVEDVQFFLNREARTQGGKLVKMRQGKETTEFLQALGGVVMVRRGSSGKFDSLSSSMFCGRRFQTQITFDEVDFATTSLCSGFPFLITKQGKCYLWKGKGSSVEELSCARLLGMDLALTGEITEVEDGKESANFWALFGSAGSRMGSADHWRLKPKYERYCGRLFRSLAEGRDQIVEVSPFDQRDLSPDGIYVLDVFFEMYIIVGRQSQNQYAAFHNALDFAQEYAILAAGMEDRPFVPISTVVLEGIPRDLKSVFRKWSDKASPTQTTESSTSSPRPIKRGRSLRVVSLTAALQALAD